MLMYKITSEVRFSVMGDDDEMMNLNTFNKDEICV